MRAVIEPSADRKKDRPQLSNQEPGGNPRSSRAFRQEVAEGLLYAHSRVVDNSKKTLQAMSFLYALIELLEEKGLIDLDELDGRKEAVAERLVRQFKESGAGALFQDPEYDKYAFEDGASVDCASRISLCKAACCRLPFALSKQDIREGVVRWDLGQPYLVDQGQDGYCNHLDRCTGGCTIYEQRPVPCRGFDCRTHKRIWLDFDNKVVNPQVRRSDWPRRVSQDQQPA